MAESPPTIGRVVHFTGMHGRCLAAMVTAVMTDGESLDREPIGAVVFNENGTLAPDTGWRALRGEPGEPHTWHWPERA